MRSIAPISNIAIFAQIRNIVRCHTKHSSEKQVIVAGKAVWALAQKRDRDRENLEKLEEHFSNL